MLKNKPVKNIFLIGESGSGKSSLINLMTNYFRNGELKKPKISIPTRFYKTTEEFGSCENNLNNTKDSKTTQCFCYTYKFEGIILNIFDSPGLNDTRGIKQDEANIQLILNKIIEIGEISSIVIVINGTTPRLSVNIINFLVKIKGNFPDSVLSSICFMLTNCWGNDSNFDITSLKQYLKPDDINLFYVNNSMFSQNPYLIKDSSWKRLQNDWDDCMDVIKNLILYIIRVGSVSSEDFKIIRECRNTIKAQFHQAKLQLVFLLKAHDEIIFAKAQLEFHLNGKQTFENYTQNKEVDSITLVGAKYYSTICSNCNTVCHDDCRITETVNIGSNIFQGCVCMTSSGCKECPMKCGPRDHYHDCLTTKKEKKTLTFILNDIKDQYDLAVKGEKESRAKIDTAENSMKTIEGVIKQKGLSIVGNCKKIKEICSGFNFVDELNCLIKQMELESASFVNIKVRCESDEFIRSLKTLVEYL
ncbi:hypothetical protein RB653_006609 [Dictyostelium firmibasis]|uniref:G domain-containing protein n=1 Tax=Dictyostelium firmibasis TaxID=79012 RepID=A0AAN7YN97_9MYCE